MRRIPEEIIQQNSKVGTLSEIALFGMSGTDDGTAVELPYVVSISTC
jgi:hypothetical protein